MWVQEVYPPKDADGGTLLSFTLSFSGVNVSDTESGKDINAYSFFPCEGEILLSPNHRFIVSSAPYERGGYTMVDMVQQKGGAWIS